MHKRCTAQNRRGLFGAAGALAVLGILASVTPALAQTPSTPADRSRPFEISDNSFLVEEALNQERGVFQNIFGAQVRGGGDWEGAFTQEWPLFSHTHQIAYTVPYAATAGARGVGDALIHYRVQVLDGARLAFSPRVSLIVPTGRASRGLGNGGAGWEVNLPFSRQAGDVYVHWNAGFTHLPSATRDGTDYDLLTPRVAGSGIWRMKPMVHLMFEAMVEWDEQPEATRTRVTTIVPGLRTGWNAGDTQTIVGFGVPVSFDSGRRDAGVLLYLSYELPFARQGD